MPKRFAATEGAIEKGLAHTSPKSGAKLVGEWVAALEESDLPGAKGLHNDLARLQKELEKDEPNGDRVQKILGKLGPATTKLADKGGGGGRAPGGPTPGCAYAQPASTWWGGGWPSAHMRMFWMTRSPGASRPS